jgi:hypothetical protein
MNTLLLVNNAWDLCLNAAGNIAMATPPYARAQDVASALRLFAAECWYDTSKGIPYFEEILGQAPPASTFEQYMIRAALTVPGVVSAQCTIDSVEARKLVGQVTFTSVDGTTDIVQLGDL